MLSEQGIVAHILKTCVEEFKDIPIKEIIRYIQGKPEVGTVLVNPQGEVTRIEGLQNEDKSETESAVTFDVHFTALAPDTGEEIKFIINPEAQNKFNPGYPLLNGLLRLLNMMMVDNYLTKQEKRHILTGQLHNIAAERTFL